MYNAINQTILDYAKSNNADELLHLLTEAKQSEILPYLNLNNALSWAAHNGSTQALIYLLQHRALIDYQDADGYTPLHWAGYNGHTDTFITLLKLGADPEIKNNNGLNTLAFAKLKSADNSHIYLIMQAMVKEIIQLRMQVNELKNQLANKSYQTHGFFAETKALVSDYNTNRSLSIKPA